MAKANKAKMKTMRQVIRNRRTLTVSAEEMVRKACKVMNNRNVGALPVVDAENHLLGMISERDVVRRCIGERRRTAVTPVSEVMTKDPVFASPDDSVMVAIAKMMQNNIRHLPVVRGGIVIGCVSIREMIDELSYVAMQNLGIIEKNLPELQKELA